MLQQSRRGLLIAWSVLVAIVFSHVAVAVQINEIRIDQPGQDNDEYFELVGSPGESLDGLTYLVIGDNTELRGNSSDGIIEMALDLSGLEIPNSGFFLAARGSFSIGLIAPDWITSLNFENPDNVTHLLVEGFTGADGMDLDTDNPVGNANAPGIDDGVLDVLPWTNVVDAVGIVGNRNPEPGAADWFYGDALGFVDVGPAGSFAPAHVYRETNANSPWVIGTFSPTDMAAHDTPGESNAEGNPGTICDFNASSTCDLVDINSLTAVGDLVAGVPVGIANAEFDLNGDNSVDQGDITVWLEVAAELAGLPSAYLRGDLNLDQVVNVLDLNSLGIHWQQNGRVYSEGDINGDGRVDVSDLNLLGVNWRNNNLGLPAPAESIPEPCGPCNGLVVLFVLICTRRRVNR